MYYRGEPDIDWVVMLVSAFILLAVLLYSPGPSVIAAGFNRVRILDVLEADHSVSLTVYVPSTTYAHVLGGVNANVFLSAGLNEVNLPWTAERFKTCFVLDNNLWDCGSIAIMYK